MEKIGVQVVGAFVAQMERVEIKGLGICWMSTVLVVILDLGLNNLSSKS